MNIIIAVLIIYSIICLATILIISLEIRKVRKATKKLLIMAEMNEHYLCRTRINMLKKIEDCQERIVNGNEEAKKLIKECVVEEVPKTVFRYAFPTIPWRGK
jgi:hypothetical protein